MTIAKRLKLLGYFLLAVAHSFVIGVTVMAGSFDYAILNGIFLVAAIFFFCDTILVEGKQVNQESQLH